MKKYLVKYSADIGNNSRYETIIHAASFTDALVIFTVKFKNCIATDIIPL